MGVSGWESKWLKSVVMEENRLEVNERHNSDLGLYFRCSPTGDAAWEAFLLWLFLDVVDSSPLTDPWQKKTKQRIKNTEKKEMTSLEHR